MDTIVEQAVRAGSRCCACDVLAVRVDLHYADGVWQRAQVEPCGHDEGIYVMPDGGVVSDRRLLG